MVGRILLAIAFVAVLTAIPFGSAHAQCAGSGGPPGLNKGLFAVTELTLDIDTAATKGVWRLLPYLSEVLPVHAALLHTGKVLFFAGSGNNAFRFQPAFLG